MSLMKSIAKKVFRVATDSPPLTTVSPPPMPSWPLALMTGLFGFSTSSVPLRNLFCEVCFLLPEIFFEGRGEGEILIF